MLEKQEVMQKCWQGWHGHIDAADMPQPNPSFEKGFYAAWNYLSDSKSADEVSPDKPREAGL